MYVLFQFVYTQGMVLSMLVILPFHEIYRQFFWRGQNVKKVWNVNSATCASAKMDSQTKVTKATIIALEVLILIRKKGGINCAGVNINKVYKLSKMGIYTSSEIIQYIRDKTYLGRALACGIFSTLRACGPISEWVLLCSADRNLYKNRLLKKG